MLRTPITYYGGKQMLADHIISLIPKHQIYCEPYFGGGAVFFRKPESYLEVINDTNDNLITFYTVLRDDYTSLNRIIGSTLHSETIHRVAKSIYYKKRTATDLEMAWAVWVVTNGSFAGTPHGGWKWCNGTAGSHSGIYLNGKRADICESLHKRVQKTQISCRDGLKVISDRDTSETFFYLDPPYPGFDQKHYSGWTMSDLRVLLEKLQGIEGKFILSNYWSQTLRYFALKNNWTIASITSKSKVAFLGARRRGKTAMDKTEILVMNFRPEPDRQTKLDYDNSR